MTRQQPLFSQRAHLLLAALSGLLYFLSFPGVDAWFFAWITWVPWLLGLQGRSPRQALLGGLVLGMVAITTGFYWLLEMLQTFSGFDLWLCSIFMFILCLYQAGRFGLLGWLYIRGQQRGWGSGLIFSLAFIASETVYPLLFPFYFGATVHDVLPLVQVAELGGPITIALVLLSLNWLLARAISAYLLRKREAQPVSLSLLVQDLSPRLVGALLAVPVLACLYGWLRIHQIDQHVAQLEKFRVGMVQANMGLAEKRTDFKEGRRRHLELTRKLREEEKVDLVVWAETSLAGGVAEDRATQYYKQTLTRQLKVPTLIGAVLVRPVDDAREYLLFNSALFADENGDIVGRYDKQFLVAFSEYLPFGDVFPQLYEWSPNSSRFSPGTSYEPLRWGNEEMAVFICYEDINPGFVNKLMRHGSPGLLVNMTNDAWFGDTTEPWEHMALARLRAVEQRRYFVRSTNSGISGFVDPVGRLLQKTNTFEQAAIAEDVAWLHLWTPYRLLGDIPWWAATALAFLFAWLPRRRETARPVLESVASE